MELKSVTVQMKVRGRDETHELTWDPKVKAYVSASGTVKVKDPKAKKVEVLVRKTVLDKWDTFKGKCGVGGSNEEICKIDDKKRHQQITVRFAPTAKAAEASRGFFADYTYTDDEVKEGIKEWVTDKIAQGELKGPPASHLKALESQLKGHKLTKDELWIRLEGYTQSQRDSVRNRKPLFKWVPRTPIQIVITPPKPTAVVANAKAAITNLDRSIRMMRASKSPTLNNLKKTYQNLDRYGEKVWFAMQTLQKSTDPNAPQLVKQLKEARARYNQACQDVHRLIQQKVAASVANLEVSGNRLETIAAKGPAAARALQHAKRAFTSQYHSARKNIVAASKIPILPGEKTSLVAESILKRQKDLELIHAAGLAIQIATGAPKGPAAKEKAAPSSSPSQSPVIKKANQRLAQLQQKLAFLPERIFGQARDYDKDKMDRLYQTGRLNRLGSLATQIKKASDDINSIGLALLNSNPNVRLVLDKLTDKIGAAQAYLILEHIDKNPVMANQYPAATGASQSSYAWLADANQRTTAVKEAHALLKSLSALLGPSNAKQANRLRWSYDILMTSTNGQYSYGYKEGWERAKNVLGASFNYQMYKRTPYRAPQETGRPAGKAEASSPPPSYPASVQLAFNAVKRAYASLYVTSPMGDKDRKFIYEDEVSIIAKQLDDASKQMDAISIDDSHSVVALNYSKLTKAQGLYNILKAKPEKRIPALLNEVRQCDKQIADDTTDAGLGASKRKLYQLKDRLQTLGRIREAGMPQALALIDRAIAKADQKIARLTGIPTPPSVREPEYKRSEVADAAKAQTQRIAHLQYIPIRNQLSTAIAAAKMLYEKFFDEDANPKIQSLSPSQISQYRAQLQKLDRALEAGLSDEIRSKLSREDQQEWDGLQPEKSIAQGRLSDVTIRVNALEQAETERQAAARKPAVNAPPSAEAKSAARVPEPSAPSERSGGLASKDAAALLEEVQRLRSMAVATGSLSDAAIHRDGIITIAEEAHRRGMKSLEASAQRALKTVNAKVVELGGIEKRPRLESEPARAAEPAAKPETPTVADIAAQRRTAAVEKLRLADEAKKATAERLELVNGHRKELRAIESQIQKFKDDPKQLGELEGKLKTMIAALEVLWKNSDVETQAKSISSGATAALKTITRHREVIEIEKSHDEIRSNVRSILLDAGKRNTAKELSVMEENLALLVNIKDDFDSILKETLPKLKGDTSRLRDYVHEAIITVNGYIADVQEAIRITKMEQNIPPAKPEAKPVTLPGEQTPTAPKAVTPTPPPTSAAGAAAKLGEIRGRTVEMRLKVDQFTNEVTTNPDLASEATFHDFLSDLKKIDQDIVTLEALKSDTSVSSDAASLKSSAVSLRNDIINNAAFILKLACAGSKIKSLALDQRLKKLQGFKAELIKLKGPPEIDAPAAASVDATIQKIQEEIDSLEAKKGGEPVANIVGRLNYLEHLNGKVRPTADGKGIVLENVSKNTFKQEMTATMRAFRPLDPDTPERPVVAVSVQVYPNELLQEVLPFKNLFASQTKDVTVLGDPRVGQAKVTVTLFFDKSSVDAQRRAAMSEADAVLAERKKQGEALEAQRLEPLNKVRALAVAKGGKAEEVDVSFTPEGKKSVLNRFYGSRIRIGSASDAAAYVAQVRSQMNLDANEMVMMIVGSPNIAKALQSELSVDTRDKAVFLANGLPPNAMVLITRSAYQNASYKGREYPFEVLSSNGQVFNVAIGDWAKDRPAYGPLFPVIRKLGVSAKSIERINPQAKAVSRER